jgi:hypothetical protein
MTGTRISAGILKALVSAILLGALAIQSAQAQDGVDRPDPGAAGSIVHFDIPAQPLAEALKAYGKVSELSVLVDSGMLEHRTSAPLQGSYAPHEALQRMLAGTGLRARFPISNAASIVPIPPDAQAPAPAPSEVIPAEGIDGIATGGTDYRAYVGLIQMRLTQALCESPVTRPGRYRMVVQLRVGQTGAVVASRLVDSTGDATRDTAIERAVRDLVIDAPPSTTMPQPVTILLRPDGDGISTVCPPATGQD